MITNIATIVYCILSAAIIFRAQFSSINSHCGSSSDILPDECSNTGYADWFIILDVSNSTGGAAHQKQIKLANSIVQTVSDMLKDKELAAKYQLCIMMATTEVRVIRQLCDDDNLEEFPSDVPASQNTLLQQVLVEVDKQSTKCETLGRQRIVLYITHSLTTHQTVIPEASKIFGNWSQDYRLLSRATQVYVFEMPSSSESRRSMKSLNSTGLIRGHLVVSRKAEFLNQLAEHVVQCSCRLTEDCKVRDLTVSTPCHFNITNGKEQCTKIVDMKVIFKPKFPSERVEYLQSCSPLTYRIVNCDIANCTADCNKKPWSPWSACDGYGMKSRSRSHQAGSYSAFTESCPKTESVPCVLTTTTSTTTIPTTTTIPPAMPASSLILIIAFIVLGITIVAAILAFLLVKRRRRRRQSGMLTIHHKGRGRGRRELEPDSAASTATQSRMTSQMDTSNMSRGPGSTWGHGSVSFVNIEEVEIPKRRRPKQPHKNKERQKTPPKKDDRRKSTSRPAKESRKSTFRPRSVSKKVSSSDHKRRSDH